MNNRWFYSLRFRVLIAILITVLALLGGGILNTHHLLDEFAEKNTRAIISQTSEILNLAIVPRTTNEELGDLKSYLNELIQGDGQALVYLALLDDENQTLAQTPDTPFPLPEADTDVEAALKKGVVHVVQPILFADNRIGRLHFGFSSKQIAEAKERILVDNLFLLGSGLLFSLAVMIAVGGNIGKQLNLLVKASQALAAGKPNVRAFENGKNELCHLAHNFNLMADAVERRTAELQSSQDKLNAIFSGAQDGILVANAHSKRFVAANPSICQMTGYRQDELTNLTIENIDSKNYIFDLRALFNRLINEEVGSATSVTILRKNGTSFPADISVSTLTIDGQTLVAGFFRDITERVQTEQALREHRENLEKLVAERTAELEELTAYNRMLFESSPVGLALSDTAGHLMDLNAAFLTTIGYSAAEAKSLSYHSLTPTEYREQEQIQLAAVLVNGRHGPYEKELLHKLGYRVPVRVNSALIIRNGQKYIWSSVENVIDERNYRRQLETIIESLPTVFSIKDLQGRYVMVNRRYEEAMGTEKQKVVGASDHELFPKSLAESVVRLDRKVLEEGQALTFEEQMPHPDGQQHTYLTTKVPLKGESGATQSMIVLATDITEQKTLQSELASAKEEAERLMLVKSEFLANMSHEIRTPLNAVLGLAKIGFRDTRDPASHNLFQHILASGQHLLGLLNDILDFSKLEAGKVAIEQSAFCLSDTINHAIELISEQAEAKQLRVDKVLAADLPNWVIGDELRLRQILLNLLSNATKFTDNGSVTLTVTRADRSVVFIVADTGIGMSEAQLEHLFSPFEQGDSSISRRYGGTGLGLAICHTLVQLMGGKISAESKKGQGSRFKFDIPLPETTAGRQQKQPTGSRLTNRLIDVRILVAEDVDINRFILEDMLKHEGADAIFVENGKLAVEQVESKGAEAFDIVLMDIQMPIMDGYEACRRIHQIAPQLPVIGLTAHALPEEKQRSLHAGMLDHVTKPIDVDTLVAVIQQCLCLPLSHANQRQSLEAADNVTDDSLACPSGIGSESVITTFFAGNRDIYRQMLQRFHNEFQTASEALQKTTLTLENLESIRELAHKFKSSGGYIGAFSLQKTAVELEQLCQSADIPAATQKLVRLRSDLEGVLDDIGRLVNEKT
ncbi:MAG: PAS domain S-box protein [Gammaproteobacteria bacterium]